MSSLSRHLIKAIESTLMRCLDKLDMAEDIILIRVLTLNN